MAAVPVTPAIGFSDNGASSAGGRGQEVPTGSDAACRRCRGSWPGGPPTRASADFRTTEKTAKSRFGHIKGPPKMLEDPQPK